MIMKKITFLLTIFLLLNNHIGKAQAIDTEHISYPYAVASLPQLKLSRRY